MECAASKQLFHENDRQTYQPGLILAFGLFIPGIL